ncbi:MAG: TIGR03960 family B12-binding radical SAM protein [Deltaproteobacteria bacterium]|nr:TIGR03960 family B12-binding radical SAM protein [Deltaproteobacteria bacterium]
MDKNNIKDFLPLVKKPSRYIGGEVNSVKKDLSKVRLKFGLGFPDAYEVGMSHLGLQILYQILNSREEIACERVYAPWTDMEELLRKKSMRLTTLESSIPLSELDIMGFSLQYELSYTNVINMLDLGGITLFSKDRKKEEPFVLGGGPVAFNPEPVADFFDAFLLGDGEEAVLEIAEAIMEGRKNKEVRADTLKRLAGIEGVYVPSFFDIEYNPDGTVRKITPLVKGYDKVAKRVVPDINGLALPTRPVIPFMETIHDRVSVEISRGCTRGCRFCQAGSIYRPVRERTPDKIVKIINEALENTGYDEVSLLSLSTGDYTYIEELLTGLMGRFAEENIAVSLPSLRVGTLSAKVASEIKRVRKTGFTLAPEAGSERLRLLINKGIEEEDLLAATKDIFTLGWKSVKLYFMLGLPTETDDDLREIVRLAECVKLIGKKATGGKTPQINVSVASFIPKPYTPFQWEPQITREECVRKQSLLRGRLGALNLGFKWHDPQMSILEGVFSRGDRRLSVVLLKAFRKGCRFDGWSEHFSFTPWEASFSESGIAPAFYTGRRRPFDEVFPWDHLNTGVTKTFLEKEYERALLLSRTPDCKVDICSNCGVCDHRVVKNRPAESMDAFKERETRAKAAEGPHYKVRLRFSKTGELRFLSHLELINAMTRAIKRAGLPLRYSQGFHPLPKVSFASSLPVGLESLEEYMDVELNMDGGMLAPGAIVERLNGRLPEGLKFHGGEVIPLKLAQPSAMINEYLIFLKNGPAGLNIEPQRIDGILRDFLNKASTVIRIQKEDKVTEVDLRPQVAELTRTGDSTLRLVLKRGQGPSARPHDVVACLFGIPREDASLIPVLKVKAVQ